MDLDLYLHGELVAHTVPVSGGRKARVVYEPWVAERYRDETPLLSCSITTGRPSEPSAAGCFLEGLLPEGQALTTLAARLAGVGLDAETAPKSVSDTIGLLGEYGRECAGAVAVVPRGEPAPDATAGYLALDDEDLRRLVADLPQRPLGVDPTRDIRMSLAGAQPKLLLARFGGHWFDPVGGAASTHILKPTGRWPASAENEAIVMGLARAIGLTGSRSWVETVDGRTVFVGTRFDRSTTVGPDGTRSVTRLHQEDLCQAMKVRPQHKYDVGRFSGRAVRVLSAFSADPQTDIRTLFRQLAIRSIVGDEDGHAKNYGLLLDAGSVRLAPLYDSVCTVAYGELAGTMGAPVGRQVSVFAVDHEAMVTEGTAFGIPRAEVETLLEELVDRLRSEILLLPDGLATGDTLTSITRIIGARLELLATGDPMGRPEPHLLLDKRRGRGGTFDRATVRR